MDKPKTLKVKKYEMDQEEFITWILDNTLESSTFRVYASINYTLVGIDKVDMGEEGGLE